jgi:hypothetical protein
MRLHCPPMIRTLHSLVLLSLAPFLAARLTAQQPTFNSSSCPCPLRGTVLDSVTGNPVHGALVQSSTRSTFTDSEGKFQLEALPAGPTSVQAAKPGYLSDQEFGTRSPKSFSFQFGPDAPPAVLKLTPEGVVFGQVTDENGEPLEGFAVSLVYRNPIGRGRIRNPRLRAVTDDEGKFRIAGLHSGTCFLAVRPNEGPAQTSAKDTDVPQGFVPVFYPAAHDMNSATPVRVRPGSPTLVNLSLKREPFVRLSGTVSGYSPEQQVALNLQDSLGDPLPQQIAFEAPTGNFYTKWIPPGSYSLSAQTFAPVSADAASAVSSARQSINANSSLSGIHLVFQPTVNIPVVIRGLPSSSTENESSPVVMLLLLAKGQTSRGTSHYATTGNRPPDAPSGPDSLTVAGVEPGTYDVNTVVYRGSSYYLESVSWGSTNLLHEPLVLDSSGAVPPIDVVVRDGAGTLSGTVLSGDQPASAAVVVFPSDQRIPPGFAFSGPEGAFQLQNLAPDTYRVIALDNYSSLDLENQNVLRNVASKAQEVTVAPKQTVSLQLQLTTVGE